MPITAASAALAPAVNDSLPCPSRKPGARPFARQVQDPPEAGTAVAKAARPHALRQTGGAAQLARRAVVLDVETSSQRQLCGELDACGWEVVTVHELAGLAAAMDRGEPELVVAEYRLAGKCVLDLLGAVPRGLWPHLVIVTSYGSVASAVRAVKLGVGGYLVKPASGVDVLRAAGLEAEPAEEPASSSAYVSLDRAIWEVLNEAVEQAGTVSGAARRLGLHARSLRRMLAKYPPAH